MSFYTYMWLRKDGTPYYVGKGSWNRAFVKHIHNGLKPPTNRECILVQEWESEAEAYEAEKFLITFYGRKKDGTGVLQNFQEGGQGTRKARQKRAGRPRKDITGQKFGRLTVLCAFRKSRHALWECLCDCGNTSMHTGGNLRLGIAKSCGCLNSEHRQNFAEKSTTHGHMRNRRATPTYKAYQHAKARCENTYGGDYTKYGGRGVEFRFNNFSQWYAELGDKPEPKRLYTIGRKNDSGHYEPGNVEWITRKEQVNRARSRVTWKARG